MEQEKKRCKITYECVMSFGRIAWVDIYVNNVLAIRKLTGDEAEEFRLNSIESRKRGEIDLDFSYARV